ncbi:MAG: ATP-binding protein [Bacteroidota bacterium]
MSTKISNKELKVSSKTENLAAIREFVRDASVQAGLNSKNTDKIVLAVDEACSNIIKHAYAYSANGKLEIKVKSEKEKISITIVDHGSQFDPSLIPEPNLKQIQEERRGGGLGMFLMKKLMDEVKYTNLTKNKNQVVLVKYLT